MEKLRDVVGGMVRSHLKSCPFNDVCVERI